VARKAGEKSRIAQLLIGSFGSFRLSRGTAESTTLLPREVFQREIYAPHSDALWDIT
jgi:hypothetical protein